MRHFDLTPLYRTTVGFDRLGSLLDTLGSHDNDAPSYPPYNIELVDENAYGIAARSFERRFQLADHVLVKGARLENGLLHVDLVRELPEAMKPRTIPISTNDAETKGEKPRVIDSKAA